jgi:hypothetical protein
VSDERRQERDPLERNVEKLLCATPPELALPDEDRRRILERLVERHEPTRTFWRRPLSWAAAAAALLFVALLALWPGGEGGGLAWADVVQHLSEMRTLSARLITEESGPSGPPRIHRARLYQQDPGLSRTEMLAGSGSDDEVVSVRIAVSGAERATILLLQPGERMARRTVLTFGGRRVGARAALPPNPVAEAWERMKEITSDQARCIGDRILDDVDVTGFEADLRNLFRDPQAARPEGTIRIWAARDTGLPVAVELELVGPMQTIHRTRFDDLEWNAPLSEELFREPDLSGWQVVEERVHQVEFARDSLRDGVTLRIGPADDAPVLTEDDVAAVLSGKAVWAAGAESPRRTIDLRATPSSARRLAEYTRAHRGESVVLNFNGEVVREIRIGGVIHEKVQLDITPLGLTLEQFERDYLSE